mmetsp:Transcript_33599/g.77507  ORF Transcript_33599/g.77507 Transcript_33599/m.77507 type:complete len:260 (-) Transcript_33599:445-1224(-)
MRLPPFAPRPALQSGLLRQTLKFVFLGRKRKTIHRASLDSLRPGRRDPVRRQIPIHVPVPVRHALVPRVPRPRQLARRHGLVPFPRLREDRHLRPLRLRPVVVAVGRGDDGRNSRQQGGRAGVLRQGPREHSPVGIAQGEGRGGVEAEGAAQAVRTGEEVRDHLQVVVGAVGPAAAVGAFALGGVAVVRFLDRGVAGRDGGSVQAEAVGGSGEAPGAVLVAFGAPQAVYGDDGIVVAFGVFLKLLPFAVIGRLSSPAVK